MAAIATYVFVDLETSGMPCEDLNKTRITELSLLVAKRNHILEAKSGRLPRVQHKLTMCFNPGRMISPSASIASGLDNDLLETETMFNMDVFNTINLFLGCQVKPVCLIAHNGYSFDFPILKNHFEKLNVSLSEDIMCADSLYGFYDLFKSSSASVNGDLSCDSVNNATSEISVIDITPQNNVILETGNSSNVDVTANNALPQNQVTNDESLEVINNNFDTPLTMKRQNERTPKKNKMVQAKSGTLKRKLFYDGDEKPKESFKLSQLYERVMGRPGIEAHRAENDCIMTAEISTVKAEQFVKWVDNNHRPFTDINAMKLGVPLGS